MLKNTAPQISLKASKQNIPSHYQLISEAIEVGLFYPVMLAFLKSVDEWKEEIDKNFLFEEMALEYDFTDVLSLDIRNDTYEFLEYVVHDEEMTLLTKYFVRVMNKHYNYMDDYRSENDLQSYGVDSLWQDTNYWIEDYDPNKLININLEDFAEEAYDQSFCMDKRIGIGKYLYGGKFYTLPIIYLLNPPFDDWTISSNLIADMKIALKGDEPITFDELSDILGKNYKSRVDPLLLFHLALNNAQFLTVEDNGVLKVDLSEEIVPKFYKIKGDKNFHPKKYLFCESERFRLEWKSYLNVKESNLHRMIRGAKYSKFSDHINYKELGFKLAYDFEKNNPLTKVSALDEEKIKKEIVKLIRKRDRAMSHSQITKALGIDDLPFEPKTLGPGDLMAYAMHKENIRRSNSIYVVKEMVGQQGAMAGKIPPSRVVTPFTEKNIEILRSDVKNLIEMNDVFLEWGLVDTHSITEVLANRMSIPLREIYYINKIHLSVIEMIDDLIEEEMQVIDINKKRFFVKSSSINHDQRRDGEPLYQWQKRIAQTISGIRDLSDRELSFLGGEYSLAINGLLGREKSKLWI